MKRYIVERTNGVGGGGTWKNSYTEKAESGREDLWNEVQLKWPQRQKLTQEQNKKEWAHSAGLHPQRKPHYLHHVTVSPRGHH